MTQKILMDFSALISTVTKAVFGIHCKLNGFIKRVRRNVESRDKEIDIFDF